MFFHGFLTFSADKSAARPPKQARSQREPANTTPTAPSPSKKPSRLQNVLRALRLIRSQRKVDEQYHHHQVKDILPAALQVGDDRPPCTTTHEGPTVSASARPSTASIPSTFPNWTTTEPARLAAPRSAATTPGTAYSSSPAAFAPNSTLPATLPATDPATDPAAVIKRIADLEYTVSELKRDNARQISETNAVFKDEIFPRMDGFAKERDAEKVLRKLAEERLAGAIESRAKTEELIVKERKEHRKAEGARLEAYYALEKKNGELQAAILDLQTPADLLDFEAIQQSLVRLGIIDPDDQQDPQAFCIAPFLRSVCAAAKRGTTSSKEGPDQEHKEEQELATEGHRTFEVSDDADSCSEPVSDEPPRALSKAPAPTQWLKNGSTRAKRFA
ncbi:hypothetical protein FRC04_010968 [Tulasnella sp. 424]|nr:hypothetical protein FRC04_010968 [Tulasnella sp. 424]KAG8972130.1 hypothetical protein FRC05_010298 [Tulasnella sp. 425]